MTPPRSGPDPLWRRAELAATLLAINPKGLGGIHLRARCGPVRDRFTDALSKIDGKHARIHPEIDDVTLFGGLDVALSLSEGRSARREGIAQFSSLIWLSSAERASHGLSARLALAMDTASFGTIAIDEGAELDEALTGALSSRLAFYVSLNDLPLSATWPIDLDVASINAARRALKKVTCSSEVYEHLSKLTVAFGIENPRWGLLALPAAKTHAALYARKRVTMADLKIASELVLAPRATQRPQEPTSSEAPDLDQILNDSNEAQNSEPETIPEELLLEAVRALLPPDLLARTASERAARGAKGASGSGAERKSNRRGRPLPSRPGPLTSGNRLDLIATLRASVPWQPLRRKLSPRGQPLQISARDFLIKRNETKSDRLLIFAVDAS